MISTAFDIFLVSVEQAHVFLLVIYTVLCFVRVLVLAFPYNAHMCQQIEVWRTTLYNISSFKVKLPVICNCTSF